MPDSNRNFYPFGQEVPVPGKKFKEEDFTATEEYHGYWFHAEWLEKFP